MNRTTLLVLIGGLALVGCEDKKPAGPAARPRPATTMPAREPDLRTVATILDKQKDQPAAGGATNALPSGHPPIGVTPTPKQNDGLPTGHPPIGIAPPPAASESGGLKYTAPSAWKQEAVTKPMRKAQFVLPKAPGDPEDGQLVVFYFGKGQGGQIEANISRWRGMFTTPEGKPVGDDAVKRESIQVDGMNVTLLDVVGRYTDQMGRPGQPGATDRDFRLLAAIVEAADGPWFFKAVGPIATVTAHAATFREFIRNVHK